MKNDDELSSQCIQMLADMSKTPQHELIPLMIEYYDVQGTKDLNGYQMYVYVQKTIKERLTAMKTLSELKKIPNLLFVRVGEDGGIGEIWKGGKRFGSVIWSFGGGWEHVSVAPFKHSYTPSWDDMCTLKDMFFRDDEVVVQYHPAKSEYVNNMPNCLHLWRPIKVEMPTPPSIMVGVRDGETNEEVLKEIADIERRYLQ